MSTTATRTAEEAPGHGFGTGPVFLASISTILGAIMFLRFGYAVGNVGLLGTLGIILLGNDLHGLVTLLDHSRRTGVIIRQNLAWALVYNLLALPAAAAGLVLPWMAALGMSLSSLLVVFNSARLGETE